MPQRYTFFFTNKVQYTNPNIQIGTELHSEKCKNPQKLPFAKCNFNQKLHFQKCNCIKLVCLAFGFLAPKQPEGTPILACPRKIIQK